MQDLIADEIREALEAWDRPKQWVRVVALGHPVHLVPGENENEPAREVPHIFRQKLVYAYVFEILRCVGTEVDHGQFQALMPKVLTRVSADPALSQEEREAAESFAWKVLRVGWNHALTGFPEQRYVTLQKVEAPAMVPATSTE
jgi:hypothetical protein